LKNKRILVHGAGGAPTTNFIRSLRMSREKYFIIGIDCNKYNLQRSEADKNYLIPPVNDPLYEALYIDIIKNEEIDFIHSQIDQEIPFLSENKERLGLPLYLPSHNAILIFQNKMKSYEIWKKKGIKVPLTILLHDENDLKNCFRSFGPMLWIREIQGSAGRNSIPTENYNLAREWISRHEGWGRFSASECLIPETVTWMSIWKEGELIVAQTRKRLYWESSNRSPSGVTGITGTGITFSNELVNEVATTSIYAVEKRPNGIHSIDMTYDRRGIPNPTENNVGRFFTTHFFFAKAGLNMPYIYTKLGLNEDIPSIKKKINPLPDGLAWIRGMDIEPILTTVDKINESELELIKIKKKYVPLP